jgi:hypothetical protein
MRAGLLLSLLLPAALPAQFHATARVGVADHSGHARDDSDTEQPRFGPATSRNAAFALGIDFAAWRIALLIGRETPDLVLVGETTGIITRDALASWQLGLEVGRRLAGHAGAPSLHLLGGGGITRWSFPGFEDPAQTRLGAWLAVEGGTPLVPHLDGVLRFEAMRSGSLFETDDLPEGYQALAARRIGLSLGLRWRR